MVNRLKGRQLRVEQTKREIEYTLVLSEDEADLLISILGDQTTNGVGPVQRMFDALNKAGARYDQWAKTGGDGYNKNVWRKRDNL